LSPVDTSSTNLKLIKIPTNSRLVEISQKLQDEGIIRNSVAFELYVRLTGKSAALKAGVYRLSASQNAGDISEHLQRGESDTFDITFYPGATLVDIVSKRSFSVVDSLLNAGYSQSEIDYALDRSYDSPLFASKPRGTTLEGYVYGETYKFSTGATVEDILQTTFDEFYKVIEQNDLIKRFETQGLNLYQGITLASIIQREANTPSDQKQIAQVFYTRLALGMQLGSDVTYQYIADRDGLVRTPTLDSPYNTRKYTGLPPGPIAAPGLSALIAVAYPAPGDYLYFLSGDDDVTYFGRSASEHESNIVNHCKVKCLIQ
jgi:UPF0755 protein